MLGRACLTATQRRRLSIPHRYDLRAAAASRERGAYLLPSRDADIVVWYPGAGAGAGPAAPAANGRADGANGGPGDEEAGRRDLPHFLTNWPLYACAPAGRLVRDRGGAGVLGREGGGEFLMPRQSRILTGQMGRTATGRRGMERGDIEYESEALG